MNALKLIGRSDDDAPDWTDRLMRQWQRYPADPSGRGDFPNAQQSGMASHDLLTGADPREVVNPDAPLTPDEEARFRAWLKQNPDSTKTDAELRQMWRAQQAATPAAATENPQVPSYPQIGDWRDTLHRLRPWREPGNAPMERTPSSDAWGIAPTDRSMEVQPRRLNALQGPMPIAAQSYQEREIIPDIGLPKPNVRSWEEIQREFIKRGIDPEPFRPGHREAPGSQLTWTPNVPNTESLRQGWVDERDVPLPTWGQRLSDNRSATYQADPGMVVQPRRADTDSLYGNSGYVAPDDLRPLPANTPVWQLPSYQQGTDYVPEDGPAKLHEGEMVIPKREADRIRAADMPSVTVKPRLSPEEIKKRLIDKGYSAAGAEGILRNINRESGFDPSIIGDHGTSGGLFQHHQSRLAELKDYAKSQGKPWNDPTVQIDFADKEMRDKFPALRAKLVASSDPVQAEDSFKRIFERPASVMWSNDASGRPVLGNDRYGFSDYALGEHQGRRGTSLLYMDPQDYLDLSPPFDDDPKTSRSGRSLRASVGRGDAVESVPSLDMRVNGQTGTVTAQDGRNRALLAQEEGLDAIPVAVRQKGQGEPTEIAGMSGTILPNDFRKAEHVSRETSPDRSILGRAMDMIIPRAQAQEAKPGAVDWGTNDPVAASAVATTPGGETWGLNDPVVGADTAKPQMSFGDSIMSGIRDPIEGGAQLLSHLMPAGVERGINTANNWLARNTGLVAPVPEGGMDQMVRDREARLQAEGVGTIGRFTGNVASPANFIPMGALGRVGGMLGPGLLGAAGRGAAAGAAGALTQPVTGGDFLTNKAEQLGGGVIAGGALGAAGGMLPKMLGGPAAGSTARTLMDEGVTLTPGQMGGGAAKRTEDAMASIPVLGSTIRAAQRQSIETFNRAAMNRALGEIGEKLPKGMVAGHTAIDHTARTLGNAYDQVLPRMTGQMDAGLRGDLVNVATLGQNLPGALRDQLMGVIQHDVIGKFSQGGGVTGKTAQEIGTNIDNLVKTMGRSESPDVRRLGTALREVDASLDRMMERNNPGLYAEKLKIDKGWAQYKIIEKAAQSLGADAHGVFTPAQLSSAVRGASTSKDKAAFAKGHALMQDLSSAAKDVLPQKVPDSGTAERGGLLAILGGGGVFHPGIAAGLGAGAAMYTSPGIKLLNAIAGPNTRNFLNTMGRGMGPPTGIAAGIAGSNALAGMTPQ